MKEKIKQLEKELAELKAEFENNNKQPEKWQDKLVQPKDSYYYYLATSLDKCLRVNYGRYMDRKPEYAFATKEQAELIKEKMLLMQEMYAFAHVRNEGWLPDWDNSNQERWGLGVYKNVPAIDSYRNAKFYVFGIAVKSKEIAEEMLGEFGKRIEKYYNKQY